MNINNTENTGGKNCYSKKNYPPIPTREEFHLYTSNLIYDSDFLTYYPQSFGYNAANTANSIKWTKNNTHKSKFLIKPKRKNIGGAFVLASLD